MKESNNELTINSEIKLSPVFSALKNSVYPGAKDESVMMVIDYCRAAALDPMLKVVHIVPMYIEDKQTGIKGMRDIVMPGIDLHRIKASRTGTHMGTSEPEYFDIVTKKVGNLEITFPGYAIVRVRKLMPDGTIAEFVGKEYWLENYASKSRDDKSPNAMWAKRPFAQLAKCAEAQALRRGYPEICALPTAEEMEGKFIESLDNVSTTGNSKISNLAAKLKGLTFQQTSKSNDNPQAENKKAIENEIYEHLVDAFTNNIVASTSLDELEKIGTSIKDSKEISDEHRKQLKIVYNDKIKALKIAKGQDDFIKEMDGE